MEKTKSTMIEKLPHWLKVAYLIAIIYLFLFSINLLGQAFRLLGSAFAEKILVATSNPFLGLFLGLASTSIIQTSAMTVATVVSLVSAGALTISSAIPMVMGANIGTTVTNIFVSFGHAGRRLEFKRAFSAAVVHDFFNILSVIALFPIEIKFHIIEKTAVRFEHIFENVGGLCLFNPLKFIIDPVMTLFIKPFTKFANPGIILCFVAIILLFVALTQIVVMTRTLLIGKIETFLDKYIFRNDLSAFLTGLVLTSTVQSSSVTTSLIVPLAGAGLLSLSQVFPYTLGTNIGSTVIVVFASLTTGNAVAITTAFCHTLFNCFGICIFYPLRILPITLAGQIGEFIGKAQRNVWIVIGCFFTLYLIPILFFTLK